MINKCFEIFAKIYATCASKKEEVSFLAATRGCERLLSFVEGDGVLERYLRKCLLLFSESEDRTHFLTAIEYEFHIALKKTDDETEIRALTLARKLLDGFDLQRNSDSPIPQFITSLACFELDESQMKHILYLVIGSPPEGSYGFLPQN